MRALVRSVGIHLEEETTGNVRNVGVFPAEIHDATVGRKGRLPVVLLVEGQTTDRIILRVEFERVRYASRSGNARDGDIAGGRGEDHGIVRHIAGVVTVRVGKFGQLRLHRLVCRLILPRRVEIEFKDVPTAVARRRGDERLLRVKVQVEIAEESGIVRFEKGRRTGRDVGVGRDLFVDVVGIRRVEDEGQRQRLERVVESVRIQNAVALIILRQSQIRSAAQNVKELVEVENRIRPTDARVKARDRDVKLGAFQRVFVRFLARVRIKRLFAERAQLLDLRLRFREIIVLAGILSEPLDRVGGAVKRLVVPRSSNDKRFGLR